MPMKLVSMKKGGHADGCKCCDTAPHGCGTPDYSWGLQITLQEEEIEKLGLKALPAAGALVALEAVAKVTSVGETEEDGKPRRRLELTITDLGFAAAGTNKYAKMYAGDESMES